MSNLRADQLSLKDYIYSLYCKNEDFSSIYESVPHEKRNVQISPIEGKIIYIILKLHKAVKVLEIGSFAGYSTSWISKALPKNGLIVSIEKNKKNFELAKKNLATDNKVILINESFEKYIENSNFDFDTIFIDAKKESYSKYLSLAYKKLKPGTLILADNSLLFGKIADGKDKLSVAMRKFNAEISNQEKYLSIILPTDDGLTVAIKI